MSIKPYVYPLPENNTWSLHLVEGMMHALCNGVLELTFHKDNDSIFQNS